MTRPRFDDARFLADVLRFAARWGWTRRQLLDAAELGPHAYRQLSGERRLHLRTACALADVADLSLDQYRYVVDLEVAS